MFEIGEHPLALEKREAAEADGFVVENLVFRTNDGEAAPAILTRPESDDPAPAILYLHAHGNRYPIGASELLDGRPALQGPLGPVFARLGYVALAIDMPGFGGRATQTESALAKARLWRGKSLAGQMLGEQASALDWLAAQPFVDTSRIGAFGISMGATFGYWLAAVEPRIAAVAHLCCYADFELLIETGAHDLHGIYLTVPGLLNAASNGETAGLIAPRPQLIGIGDRDELTPPQAVDRALAETREAYASEGASDALVVHREAETGHQESPAMRQAVLEFFAGTIGSAG
ncbi:MAG: dienelactone hydrolase family protein [Rhizobiaceae bacterium]|nr:dienelactone hydrolase family protein [Rhizobiaceae bacterium]